MQTAGIKKTAIFFSRLFAGPLVPERMADTLGYPELGPGPWAESKVPLEQSKVAIVSTAGLFVKGQKPFRESLVHGDFSYRILQRDIPPPRFSAGKQWIDRRLILMDPNLAHPIDRLKEFKERGVIKEAAANHYSFCAYCSDHAPLAGGSAKEVALRLRYEGVDKVVVIASSLWSQESAVIIQRVIENEGIPTVSLIYSREAAARLKPPRACLLGTPLHKSHVHLTKEAQTALLERLLSQFGRVERQGVHVDEIAAA